jgi:hypothetical protein
MNGKTPGPSGREEGAVVGTLIVSEFVTLDGVMEAPGGEPTHPHSGWVFDHIGQEQQQHKLDEVREADALLTSNRNLTVKLDSATTV